MIPDGFDMNEMLAQAQALQARMAELQQELATSTFTGSAGGDLVRVTINGEGEIKDITIAPEAVDPDDLESLSDLIIAAHRAARTQVQDKASGVLPDMGGMPDISSLGF